MYLRVETIGTGAYDEDYINDETILEIFSNTYNASMLDDDFYLPEKRELLENILYYLYGDYSELFTVTAITLCDNNDSVILIYYPLTDNWIE